MSIVEKIFYHADKSPNKSAIIFKDKAYSYKTLVLDIKSSSEALHKHGCKKNNKVILRAANTYQFICVYFAIHLIGAIVVLIPSERDEAFESLVYKVTHASLKIEDSAFFCKDNKSYKSVSDFKCVINSNNVADIVFSSGTTGDPKGVPITHGKQYLATENIINHVKNNSQDIELILMPLSHSFGMGRLRSVLFAGGSMIIGPAIFNLKEIFHYLKEYNVNGLGLVPSAWNILRKLSRDSITKFSNQMKYIEFGSAYLAKEEKEFISESFPKTNLVMHYGLTELSRALFINFHEDDLGAIGKLQKNVSVKIVDSNGKVIPDGDSGEIILQSSWMLEEYYNSNELNMHAFHLDHIRTGDLGKIADGYLYLTGRLKEIINVGGRQISPYYIEDKLNLLSFIEESACIGVPHEEMGESIVAFVAIKESMRNSDNDIKNQIHSLIAESTPAYMIPKKIIIIDSIPKTPSGKITRQKLHLLIKDYA
jgi:long-chain acyl-CoA synthetase